MPATQIKLDNRNESLDGVVDEWYGEKHFGVAHEAVEVMSAFRMCRRFRHSRSRWAYLVIRSSILRGSRMKVGRTTRLRSAPGRRLDMICMSTRKHRLGLLDHLELRNRPRTIALFGLDYEGIIFNSVGLGPIAGGSAA